MREISISASLVLYKPDLQMLKRTLLALQEAGRFAGAHYSLQLNLTLVDNSDDERTHAEIARWLEDIRPALPAWMVGLQRSPGNVGYGRGNNLVIERAGSDYHMVVNPDLFVRGDALLEALRYMEAKSNVGLLCPAVFSEEGARQYLCKRNPTLLIMFLRSFAPSWLRSWFGAVLDEFEMRDCDYDKEIHPVEYPTGCFMFFRTRPLQVIGGFDPNIFLHYEDADIGRRMLAIARVDYTPSVVVVHKWARDTHKSPSSMWVTIRSGWYYWRKWGGVFYSSPMKEPVEAVPDYSPIIPNVLADSRQHVLVTGANGFIGRAVCEALPNHGFAVLGAVRKHSQTNRGDMAQYFQVGNIDENTDWSAALKNIDCVVHLAARVHVMHDTSADPLSEYRRENVALTMNLARQAVAAGARRFVFVSSIKVNGESTPIGQPFTASDIPHPQDAYGISKLEAEQELMKLADTSGLEVVIIRPPLVYGPGVKANFYKMMCWLEKGVPLPFGALDNRRSLVALDNLVSFIVTCLLHRAAANQVFLISDEDDMTVTELLYRMGANFGRHTVLMPIPKFLLKMAANIMGKAQYGYRLMSSLQLDTTKNRTLLGWTPPVHVNTALRSVVQEFRRRRLINR